MATDWRTLVGARTTSQVLQLAMDRLAAAGSRITNLNVGGAFRTLLELASQGLGDLYDLLASIVPNGFGSDATGAWLTLKARDLGLVRHAAAATAGNERFVRAEGSVDNLVIPAGAVLRTPASAQGERLEYSVVTETVLEAGDASVLVPVQASGTGARYNVAAGLISELVTHVPGVGSVTNDADWITSAGRDEETDAELRARVLTRWPAVARGATAAALASWASEVEGVVDVAVDGDFPRGEGTVDVIVTGDAGAPSAELLADVQALLDGRRDICADVLARGPDQVATGVRLRLVLPADRGEADAAQAAALERVSSLLSSGALSAWPRLRIGQALPMARLVALGMSIDDVTNVAVELPVADVAPGAAGLVVLSGEPEIIIEREVP